MAKANNTSRSLVIMSKNSGWDPCKIDGAEFKHLEYDENERMHGFMPGTPPSSPESSTPNPGVPGPDTRGPGAGGQTHGHGNPYAGKSEAGE